MDNNMSKKEAIVFMNALVCGGIAGLLSQDFGIGFVVFLLTSLAIIHLIDKRRG
jgi:hypothetical protein